ncbi:MAG TPA: hypothetical protein VL992_02910 [Tepidisphaeraceae bacterium]|nr:hypothetical protein [Tepidisphaeraceae bacterium]
MAAVLIGIDDTDNIENPGTGRLARRLGEELCARGAGMLGITRHPLLHDPRIACTRYNKAACIAIEWSGPMSELEFVVEFIREGSAGGSDPGVCLCLADAVAPPIVEWGIAATQRVLAKSAAERLAGEHRLDLRALGGNGDGIIGALAAVGLRVGGNQGRFIDLPRLRSLAEFVTGEELDRMGIEVEHCSPAKPNGAAGRYRTSDWVRPRLVRGRPVWPVQWSEHERAWIAIDHRKVHPDE